MKVIDLINKIANGEEIPEKIKFEKDIFIYDKERKDYIHKIDDWYSETLMFKVMNCHFIKEILEAEFKLIEDNTIDSIEELEEDIPSREQLRKVLNEVIRVVNQHDKEIKELKEKSSD